MMTTRKCIVCGKEFTPRYQWQKCCSRECGYAHRREHHREYNRRYYQLRRGQTRAGGRGRPMAQKPDGALRRRDLALDSAEVMAAAARKPKGCPFDGECFDCPYPDCVAE